MSDGQGIALSDEVKAKTLAHFEKLRKAWQRNEPLRLVYGEWYGRLRACLPDQALGPVVELGSGPGFAREFLPGVELTDLVKAPWHDRQVAADALPYASGTVGALILLDVLHHLATPMRFFTEAVRVLRPGGRVLLCEPFLSWMSYPVYRFLHPEVVNTRVDPFADAATSDKDPFESNQAIPSLLFSQRYRPEWERRLPELRIKQIDHFAGLAYPLTGGFSGRPLLPLSLWRRIYKGEHRFVTAFPKAFAFRLLVVLEK
jgi:SAM-dependent methyltransferase